jgi:hypothetical protein
MVVESLEPCGEWVWSRSETQLYWKHSITDTDRAATVCIGGMGQPFSQASMQRHAGKGQWTE